MVSALTALFECLLTGLVTGAVIVVAARVGLIPLLVMWEGEDDGSD